MKLVADLQIHSKYSRAVSKEMVLENLDKWAKIKGIGVGISGVIDKNTGTVRDTDPERGNSDAPSRWRTRFCDQRSCAAR